MEPIDSKARGKTRSRNRGELPYRACWEKKRQQGRVVIQMRSRKIQQKSLPFRDYEKGKLPTIEWSKKKTQVLIRRENVSFKKIGLLIRHRNAEQDGAPGFEHG